MKTESPIHVICINWGSAYRAENINTLYSMVHLNTTLQLHFHLFSDTPPTGLLPEIEVHSEPGLNVPKELNRHNYRKEAGLCDNSLAGLTGRRVFFFDLDVIITENLDELFTHPKGDDFYIINDWNTDGDHVGQASCYSFVVGTLGFINEAYEAAPETILKRYGTAFQENLSAKVIERYGPLNFWSAQWFQSFRYHCLPHALLRCFQTPKPPKPGTKVLSFLAQYHPCLSRI